MATDKAGSPVRAALPLLVLVYACFATSAFASGPVFAVVPTTPAEARESAPPPPGSALAGGGIQPELRTARDALRHAQASLLRVRAALLRADGATSSAPDLSGLLEEDKRAAQLAIAEEAAVARRDRLQQQVAELERETEPLMLEFETAMPVATVGLEAVSIAERYLGVPYVWGGSDPTIGFDCSGLTMYVYAQLGIQLPHYAADQWSGGVRVDPFSVEPGDLVFFEPGVAGPGHVAIYVGDDQIVEAPHTGDVVKLASFSQTAKALGFVGATRPASAAAPAFP